MIIYGWQERSSKPKRLNSISCTKCGQGGVHSFTTFRYFHLYWIPVFPYSKKLWLTCEHCQATYEPDQKAIESSTPGTKLEAERAPLYYFSGIAVLILIFAGVAWSEMKDSEQYRAMLLQPKVGDLIVMKLEEPQDPEMKFGVARVLSVDEKEIQVTPSNYLFSTTSSTLSSNSKKILLGLNGFAQDVWRYERPRLIELFDKGSITATLRDERFLAPANEQVATLDKVKDDI